jgi:hypothetical protein
MTTRVSRRGFVGQMMFAGAAAALMDFPEFVGTRAALAHTASTDVLHETFNALLAFVVPGRDEYSIQQGDVASDPGGVEAGGVDALIATIDESAPYFPNFASFIATILNDTATGVNPLAIGPFASAFARLSSPEKAAVFQYLDFNDATRVLAGVLPAFVAFFVYSEAGSFDPLTRSLTSAPVGWAISNYSGVSDGRDEFLGYLKGK